jgi:CDP-glycerol glycerophosphotransferase (TagB/SpsB family)
MKKLIRRIFKRTLILINFLMPKNSNKAIFESFPDYADSPKALFDFMMSCPELINMKYYWFVEDANSFSSLKSSNVKFISKYGLKGILLYYFHQVTAKYLFCTHCSFVISNKQQIFINLWHGTPLKRIVLLNPVEKAKPYNNFTKIITASPSYVKIMSQCFGCQSEQVLVSGYPRNDLLFQESEILDILGIEKDSFNKIVIYLPTYRKVLGSTIQDSNVDNTKNIIAFSDKCKMRELNGFLRKLNILLIIKFHPADIANKEQLLNDFSHILILSNHELQQKHLQLYNLLRYTDALITDYSSVFCDYLLTDKPMAFIATDFMEYKDNRGFIFDDPLDMLPGRIIFNYNDFTDFIKDVADDKDKYNDKRMQLKFFYNKYHDGNSGLRILETIGLINR